MSACLLPYINSVTILLISVLQVTIITLGTFFFDCDGLKVLRLNMPLPSDQKA
jgi:hypothetical protein